MDKALATIAGSTSCLDLLKSLETILHGSKPSYVANVETYVDEIMSYFFHEYKHEEGAKRGLPYVPPDYMLIILAIISMFLGDVYIHRFALRFSKIHLSAVLNRLDDENVVRYGNALGVKIEYGREKCFREILTGVSKKNVVSSTCYRYRVPVNVYLRVARRLLTEHSWQLTSFTVSQGYVYIDDRNKVLRLISEQIYNTVVQSLKRANNACSNRDAVKSKLTSILSEFDQELAKAVERHLGKALQLTQQAPANISGSRQIKDVGGGIKISSLDELIAVSQTLFPPCIRELVNTIMRGENLSHHQRFALATYLINLDVDLELVVKLFSFGPDFNEKITRYQVEHLAGLRGSRKKYLVYSCSTMKTLGLCTAECGIKNPLLYPRKVAGEGQTQAQSGH